MKEVAKKGWIAGMTAALAASLCCIAPLLAIFGGISGAATYFNWIAPFRPYLIAITILAFAFAWYRQLVVTPRKQADCCAPARRSFWQSTKFLLAVTLFAVALTAFPYYAPVFYKAAPKPAAVAFQNNLKSVCLSIGGMGCADCTSHIDGSLMGLNGVISSSTSYEKAQTVVRYDPAKTNADTINHKIKAIGYQPTFIKNN